MSQLPRPQRQQPASSELAAALNSCRRAFLATALFSGMSNILMLTGALFMLEIYDRVLPSRSVPTLVALLIRHRPLRRAGGHRRDPQPNPCARRAKPGREPEPAGLRRHRQGAAQNRRQRRRHAADPRSRRRARVSIRRRPIGLVRPAMDAGLSRHLLFVSSLYRADRVGRRAHPRRAQGGDRAGDPAPHPERHAICHGAQCAPGGQPAQRRSDHRHGHGRPTTSIATT